MGEPYAAYMQEHDLCLEEHLDEVQSCTEKDPLEITVGDTDYKVFMPVGGTNDVMATVTVRTPLPATIWADTSLPANNVWNPVMKKRHTGKRSGVPFLFGVI
ncbi:MAG: hypothetical protein ACLT2C_08465 [Ruminococcus sp.]